MKFKNNFNNCYINFSIIAFVMFTSIVLRTTLEINLYFIFGNLCRTPLYILMTFFLIDIDNALTISSRTSSLRFSLDVMTSKIIWDFCGNFQKNSQKKSKNSQKIYRRNCQADFLRNSQWNRKTISGANQIPREILRVPKELRRIFSKKMLE